MATPEPHSEDAGAGEVVHDAFIPAMTSKTDDVFALDQDVVEVRLPVVDERRPGKDASVAELLLPDPNQHSSSLQLSSSSSSSLQLSSSSSSSLRASPAVSFSSDPPGYADNISLSSIEVNPQDVNSSSSEEADPKKSALCSKAPHEVTQDSEAQSHRSPRRRGSEDHRNEGLKLARRRYQQEKATRPQEPQEIQGIHDPSEAKQGEDALPIALTPRQPKPVSSVEILPFPLHKPVVKLPGQPSVMSYSMQSSAKSGSARGLPIPFRSGGGNNQRPISRPVNGRPYYTAHHNAPDWTTWQDLTVRIHGLPATTTTRDLYRCFSRQGTIVRIELFENTRGERDGNASVKFR